MNPDRIQIIISYIIYVLRRYATNFVVLFQSNCHEHFVKECSSPRRVVMLGMQLLYSSTFFVECVTIMTFQQTLYTVVHVL